MKLAFQLAYKNLIGAGLRTWLNVGVLSFVFVVIIMFNGLLEGWSEQSIRESIQWEYAHGHLLHKDYDPLDPFTIKDGHGKMDEKSTSNLSPILIRQATIYPEGRVKAIALKGIEAAQNTLQLPTYAFADAKADIPAIIGVRMAETANLRVGDQVLLRWRDKNGTFDAADITVVEIFNTNVASVDQGQVWIPIEKLWDMTGLENEATLWVANENYSQKAIKGWRFEDQDELLSEFRSLMQMEKFGSALFYVILLIIALIAIFDTQVLSIFRRQKEIGTYVALGMTRQEVMKLFTVEGALYSILGVIVGCIYGIPLFILFHKIGFTLPEFYQGMGINIPTTIIPVFGLTIIIGTGIILIISATIVSLLPARNIARMDPVSALKGKLQ
ncbi:MAG: ABC transporter permease [Chloroflexia bacterium]|nr:ABC transporter permease [Chloroflexia bacterium]